MHGIGFRACEVQGLFFRSKDPLAMILARDHPHGWQCPLDFAPFRGQMKHHAKRLKLAIDAADLNASFCAPR